MPVMIPYVSIKERPERGCVHELPENNSRNIEILVHLPASLKLNFQNLLTFVVAH